MGSWKIFVLVLVSAVARADDYVINIDNPSFRKLVVGIPQFEAEPASDKELFDAGVGAVAKITELLKFTELFNVMDGKVFSGLKPPKAGLPVLIKEFADVDVPSIKALGVESLTMGKIVRADKTLRIELRTADLNRGKVVLGKSYSINTLKDIDEVLKRYVDRLLEAYTGKPGIFSSKIVFIGRQTKASQKQLYIADIDGTNRKQITFDDTNHLSPGWDPSGERIVFTSFKDGKADLYMINLKTGITVKLAGAGGVNSGGAFSPTGKVVAFSSSTQGDFAIYTMTPEVRNAKNYLIGSGLDVDPSFSPDGKWLAFVSGRYRNPHIFRAELQWATETQVKVLADKQLTFAGWYNATPAWSPDSRKLAFAGYDKDIDRFDLFLMNNDGSQLERLTLKAGDNENPSWSPNGQLIIYHSNRIEGQNVKGPTQLYMMNKDGGNQRRIDVGLYEAQTPDWSPNLLK